ncbi:MAG TPA: mannose-1-phosphate guanylyltransferase/mannose-6-phosphate isomerase, partial [Steroidobacteraceae bacterium]|nr:mannose-1-phosphate guanylyltransferase/mannose-6-phosphate isomerase [Steroidobacteraceae bacterium]
MRLVPVILSGGAGTRLWPLSRELHPKQLLALTSHRTMIQETALRTRGLDAAAPVVVCNEQHRFMVAEQLRQQGVTPSAIVLEPVGRNTAPAIALAAHAAIAARAEDCILLVLPADHVIRDLDAFQAAVKAALPAAQAGKLVAFGVVARQPETGYGYIRRGASQGDVWPIAEFVEKPSLDKARQFVESGDYFWNSGMFMFGARRYLDELAKHAADIATVSRKASDAAKRDLDFVRVDPAIFEQCRSDSIDYAVMEKTGDAVMVPLDAGWSDVGSWSSLHEAVTQDTSGNVQHGDVLLEDTTGSYVYAESRLVAAIGLKDHVIVETKDAVMVAPKNRVQDVKKLVTRLK